MKGRYRFARRLLPIAACLLATGAAVWLYRESPGLAGVQGVAEAREYTVSALEAGRLEAVTVVVGERVRQGQVLASIDPGVIAQETRVAEAELQELTAEVAAEGKALDLSGFETEQSFQSDLEKVEVDLREARADCARDEGELSGVQEEIRRQKTLIERRLTSAERMHELEVRLTALQSAVTSCPSRLEALEKRREAAERRVQDWRESRKSSVSGKLNQEQLDPLVLRAARQREYVGLLKVRSANLVMKAPVDGDVVELIARRGDVLTPGDPLLKIVEANPRQVIAYLEEARSSPVREGNTALMRRHDRAGAPVIGTVKSVSGTVAQMPSRFWPAPSVPRWGRQVFIQVDPGQRLVPGEAFDVAFEAKGQE